MLHEHSFSFRRGRERLFQKGDFKYLLLDLLTDKPNYGYEIIRTLEERFQGLYAPSPGIVYPTLQLLEEMGHVTASQQDGKKVYTITESGQQFLAEREQVMGKIKSQLERWWSPEIREKLHEMMHELRELRRFIGHQARRANPEKIERIREIISRAYKDIDIILRQEK